MGGGHPDPGGGGLLVTKKIFRPFGPQFGLKIKGGGAGGPPGLSPGSATATLLFWQATVLTYLVFFESNCNRLMVVI